MKIHKIVCNKCNRDIVRNPTEYLSVNQASKLMDEHDRVLHSNSYTVKYDD